MPGSRLFWGLYIQGSLLAVFVRPYYCRHNCRLDRSGELIAITQANSDVEVLVAILLYTGSNGSRLVPGLIQTSWTCKGSSGMHYGDYML